MNDDCIFLIEFTVTELIFEYHIQRKLQNNLGEIITACQIPGFSEVPIREQENIDLNRTADCSILTNKKMGKAIVFALTSKQIKVARDKFDIKVHVYKKSRPCVMPDKILVGIGIIDLAKTFNSVSKASCEDMDGDGSAFERVKFVSELRDIKSNKVGEVACALTFHCFGHNRLTSFQIDFCTNNVDFVEHKCTEGGEKIRAV